MAIAAKICGVNSLHAAAAAVEGGAQFVGFVFYPHSPRHLTPAEAAALAKEIPAEVRKVGVVVDPSDEQLQEILADVPLDMFQLHGAETPARVAEIRLGMGVPVMKAIAIAAADDLDRAAAFQDTADWLLFDAKPPQTMGAALPGGNALAFDWALLQGRAWSRPWMLSGGITPENVAEAAVASGAEAVDVSSGVEDAPGVKSTPKILAFLRAAARASARAAGP